MISFRDIARAEMQKLAEETPEQTLTRYRAIIPSVTLEEAQELKEAFLFSLESGISSAERKRRNKAYSRRIEQIQGSSTPDGVD